MELISAAWFKHKAFFLSPLPPQHHIKAITNNKDSSPAQLYQLLRTRTLHIVWCAGSLPGFTSAACHLTRSFRSFPMPEHSKHHAATYCTWVPLSRNDSQVTFYEHTPVLKGRLNFFFIRRSQNLIGVQVTAWFHCPFRLKASPLFPWYVTLECQATQSTRKIIFIRAE